MRLGQGGLLVLADRLLRRLHAALCAGPDGHDPAHAALRCREWQPWLMIAAVGAAVILAGIVCQIMQLVVSASATARQLRDLDRRSLGRAHAGMGHRLAAAGVQFRRHARCDGEDAYWAHEAAHARQQAARAGARVQRRSRCRATAPTGFVCAFFAVVTGFALIWHIWWMAVSVCSARSRPSWCSPGATRTNTRFRPPRLPQSTAPTAARLRL